jgi:hypothetical protein
LGSGIKEAAGHFLKRDICTDALEVEAYLADIPGDGDEGKVIAARDGDTKASGGTGEDAGEAFRAGGVATEDVLAKEGCFYFFDPVAGDGAVVIGGPAGMGAVAGMI